MSSATPVVPVTTVHPGGERIVRAVESVGRVSREVLEEIGRGSRFLIDVARAVSDARTWMAHVLPQARALGVGSLPLASYIALFTGIVLSLLASYTFRAAVPLYFVGTLVEKTITMELAAVLTGLALAGRVGAGIAAELGTMRVTEQIDALETLAYDPNAYLVVPRVIAGTFMFPVVVGCAMLIGVGSGWIASVMLLDLSNEDFVKGMRLFFTTFDVQYGLVKASSFGFAVSLLGCSAGLNTRGGAQGVGASATRAVVRSAIAILVLDAFWAVVWLLGREP